MHIIYFDADASQDYLRVILQSGNCNGTMSPKKGVKAPRDASVYFTKNQGVCIAIANEILRSKTLLLNLSLRPYYPCNKH